ncbi:MAG: rod shape-determining protein MreC [Anaerolineae bacterium]|nr:rod shape-determining protein MreC [Thermoflexales bacterium]MDW8052924.1 rod shape-determining protein MreC [Anaerolineae bacterium]
MPPRDRRTSPGLLALLIAIGAIAVLVALFTRASIGTGALSPLIAPIQQALTQIGRFVSSVVGLSGELADLRTRNAVLQRQVDALAAEVMRLRALQTEVEQYRKLLKFAAENPAYGLRGADVIGMHDPLLCPTPSPEAQHTCAMAIAGEPSPFVRYLTINAGARHGIKVGMPVVSAGGALVGRIALVNETTAQVQLITDPASFVNVRTMETGTAGTVVGDESGRLLLRDVLPAEPVNVGDTLITSGLGGLLPAGLPVGTVVEITSSEVELQQVAWVRPSVDFSRLEQVLVLQWSPPTLPTVSAPAGATR